MVEIAFRAYNDGQSLVGVAFPAEGGSAVCRKAIPLSGIGLECAGAPPSQHDMPFDTFKVKNRSALVSGGLELIVDYEGERVSITPLTHVGNRLESKTVRYTFEGLGVEDARESDIQKAKSQASFRIRADELPMSDETWP